MSEQILRCDIDGAVGRLTFNRPAQGNAIDVAMADALMEAAVRLADDPAVRRAQDMILTNCRVGAEEAVAIGLVTRIVPDEALAGEGDRLAQSRAKGATGAFATARSLLQRSYVASLADHLEVETAGIVAAARSEEASARFAAFGKKTGR